MRRSSTPVRVAALALSPVLLLAACGGGGDSEKKDQKESVGPSSSPSSTVTLPTGTDLTDPGSELSFGDTATVTFEPKPTVGSVLELSVESATQGALKDFKGFNMDDPYKKNGSYFYVQVRVGNVGEGSLGGQPVPLWGVSGENTLLPSVDFTSSFKKCPTEKLPGRFAPGDSFSTCLVFLSPDHGTLKGVSYRPDEAFNPITWTGTIESPAAKPSPTS